MKNGLKNLHKSIHYAYARKNKLGDFNARRIQFVFQLSSTDFGLGNQLKKIFE